MNLITTFLLFVVVINIVTFGAFALDKNAAIHGRWRVPEKTLLVFCAIGGSIGAKLAQRLIRHKTRKQPFVRRLNLIVGVQLLLGALAVYASS